MRYTWGSSPADNTNNEQAVFTNSGVEDSLMESGSSKSWFGEVRHNTTSSQLHLYLRFKKKNLCFNYMLILSP
jgi:hypothetical protein